MISAKIDLSFLNTWHQKSKQS